MAYFHYNGDVKQGRCMLCSGQKQRTTWIYSMEKTLESPLDCKEIQPVHPKDQCWVFIGRTMLKLKLQYFGHLMQRADSF